MTWLGGCVAGRAWAVALAAALGLAEPGPRAYDGPQAVASTATEPQQVAEPGPSTPWSGDAVRPEPADVRSLAPSGPYRLSERERARGMVGAGIAVLVVGGLAGLITFGFGGTFALWSSGCSMCDSEEEEERAAEHRKYQRIAAVGGVVLGSSIITGIVLISVGSRRLRRLRGVALTPAGLRF